MNEPFRERPRAAEWIAKPVWTRAAEHLGPPVPPAHVEEVERRETPTYREA